MDKNIIDWIDWTWDIPNDAPLGYYSVKMMVLNEHNEENPIDYKECTFEVIETNSSNYNRFERVSI